MCQVNNRRLLIVIFICDNFILYDVIIIIFVLKKYFKNGRRTNGRMKELIIEIEVLLEISELDII